VEFRGNVQTRLTKLSEGKAEATFLACAGLKRLGLSDRITSPIEVDLMLPAVAQGAIGLEIREDDEKTARFIDPLNDQNTSLKSLSNLFIMQLDLASSISQDDIVQKERNKKLKALGLAPEIDTDIEKEFWQDEALSYKRLLKEVPIEKLHLTTIGTKNLEKSLKQIIQVSDINEGINAICTAFDKFLGKHRISYVMEGRQAVDFENP
ncbi:MAG: hypothetical protein ACKO9G_07250, partial [Dolichospermum sp.]